MIYYIIFGIPLQCRVYSVIRGYWSLCVKQIGFLIASSDCAWTHSPNSKHASTPMLTLIVTLIMS